MPPTIAERIVHWITSAPLARDQLQQVEPVRVALAAQRLLDSLFPVLLERDPQLAHAIADAADVLGAAVRHRSRP